MNKHSYILIILAVLLLGGCETSDSQLIDQGRTPAYIEGFHDGRHSGIKEAGNNFDHFIRDEERFATDREYQLGWLAGETEGKKLQKQAANAGAAYSGAAINRELEKQDPEKAAKDTVSNTDTSGLEDLGK